MSPYFLYVLFSAVALAVVVAVIYLVVVLGRLRALIDRLDGTAQYLEASRPKIDRILDDLEGELVGLRGLGVKLNHIAGDAERVSTDMRHALQPIVVEVSDLANTVRRLRAAAVAFRTGLSVWREHRRSDGEETDPDAESAEER